MGGSMAGSPRRGRSGLALTGIALFATGAAVYLTWTKLAHVTAVCGPLGGCQTVADSPYSVVAGVPVALPGVLAGAMMLAGALWWWRRADRRGLWVTHLVALACLPVLAWLAWLEVAVIHAVCDWCVAYSVAVITEAALATRTQLLADRDEQRAASGATPAASRRRRTP
jgi:uncharacterized membrane protein